MMRVQCVRVILTLAWGCPAELAEARALVSEVSSGNWGLSSELWEPL